MKKQTKKLEDNAIWKESFKLAEYIYEKLAEFPSEEEFNTTSKLRNSANDLIFAVSQAIGVEATPSSAEYDWSSARRYLFSLKTMYRFACRQQFIELDPEIMVSLDKLIKQVEENQQKARKKLEKKIKAQYKQDMEPWLEKYKLWKEMQG